MGTSSAVGVDDDFPSGKAGVARRSSDDELARRIDVEYKIAIKKLISDMEGNGFVKGTVLISHTFNEEGAAEAMNSVLEKFPGSSISIMKNNGLCSYYSEYGGLLIGYTNN